MEVCKNEDYVEKWREKWRKKSAIPAQLSQSFFVFVAIVIAVTMNLSTKIDASMN